MLDTNAGLIAAGTGSRFRNAGISCPKPLIEISGMPLMGWTLSQFAQAGLEKLKVIFNTSNCKPCMDYIARHFSWFEVDAVCRDTASSFESFMDVLSRSRNRRILITTTDSIYPPGKLKALLEYADTLPQGVMVLGLTGFIDDEKPLYATADQSGRVTALGNEPAQLVTNGVYLMPAGACEAGKGKTFPALRKFLAFLVENGLECHGFDMGKSVDVDRPEDMVQAERFAGNFQKDQVSASMP